MNQETSDQSDPSNTEVSVHFEKLHYSLLTSDGKSV